MWFNLKNAHTNFIFFLNSNLPGWWRPHEQFALGINICTFSGAVHPCRRGCGSFRLDLLVSSSHLLLTKTSITNLKNRIITFYLFFVWKITYSLRGECRGRWRRTGRSVPWGRGMARRPTLSRRTSRSAAPPASGWPAPTPTSPSWSAPRSSRRPQTARRPRTRPSPVSSVLKIRS